MLKSITIESWDCSFRQTNGNPAAKKLTLRNNGHVIFVEKDFGDKENTSIITHKTFDEEVVKKLLDKAEKLFTADILSTDIKTFYCDACPDMITLKKENGEVIRGQLNEFTYASVKLLDFYDYIESSLNFCVDLSFENESND